MTETGKVARDRLLRLAEANGSNYATDLGAVDIPRAEYLTQSHAVPDLAVLDTDAHPIARLHTG